MNKIFKNDAEAQAAYMQDGGLRCPSCGNEYGIEEGRRWDDAPKHIEGENGNPSVLLPLRCDSCAATWYDVYVFKGLTDFEQGRVE